MLVLTIRPGESIFTIPDEILMTEELESIYSDLEQIKCLEVNGQQVKVGITAPKYITVHRETILNRVLGSRFNVKFDEARYKEKHR